METIEKCVRELGGDTDGTLIYNVTIKQLAQKLHCKIENESVASKHVRYELYGFGRTILVEKEEWHYPQYIEYDDLIITEAPWYDEGDHPLEILE